jgi:hypothetical protein
VDPEQSHGGYPQPLVAYRADRHREGDRAWSGNAVDAVAVGDGEEHKQEAACEADPTYRVPRTPGGDQGTDDGEGQVRHKREHFAYSAYGDPVTGGLRGTGENVHHVAGDEHGHRECG